MNQSGITRRNFLALSAATGIVMAAPKTLAASSSRKNFLFIGWDGAGHKSVLPMLEAGELPNLRNFLANDGVFLPLETHYTTNTATSWTCYFTGLGYEQTSVVGNNPYKAMPREQLVASYSEHYGVYRQFSWWIDEVPANRFVFHQFKQLGYRFGLFLSKGFLVGKGPWKELAHLADHYAEDTIMNYGRDYIHVVTEDTVKFMKAGNPWIVFAHYNPDHYGHRVGFYGDRYREEIVRCDAKLGTLLSHVDLSKTIVVVLADHGFDLEGRQHRNASDCWMVSNLPVHAGYVLRDNQRAFGSLRDLAPTIMSYCGIDYSELVPVLRGKSLLR